MAHPENGPGRGTSFASGALVIDLEKQDWHKVSFFEHVFYVVIEKDVSELASALARPAMFPGHSVAMLGGFWTMPIAAMFTGNCGLPKVRAVDPETGTREWVPAEQYRERIAFADSVFKLNVGEDVAISQDDLDDGLALVLGLNYFIGPLECLLLRLLTSETMGQLTRAMLDWPAVEALATAPGDGEKKPPAGTQNTDFGAPDNSPSTSPPTPTSGG